MASWQKYFPNQQNLENSGTQKPEETNESKKKIIAPPTTSIETTAVSDIKEMLNPKNSVNGVNVMDIPTILRAALKKEKIQEENIEAAMRGYAGELVSKFTTSENIPKGLEVIDLVDLPNGYFRRDALMVNVYFQTLFDENDYPEIKNEIQEIEKTLIHTLNNYSKVMQEWMKLGNKKKPCSEKELLMWAVQVEAQTYDTNQENAKKRKTARNKLVEEILDSIRSKDIEFSTKPNIKNMLSYPDQVAIDKDGEIKAAIEVKSYTPQEVDQWITRLQTLIKMSENAAQDRVSSNLLRNLDLDRRGLSIVVGEMRLGFDPKAIRLACQYLSGRAPGSDIIDPETAEVTTTETISDIPIIVRLPKDITLKKIELLRQITDQLGVSGIFFEGLPYEHGLLDKIGQFLVKQYRVKAHEAREMGIENFYELPPETREILFKYERKA